MITRLKRLLLRQQYDPGFVGLWINPFFHARRGLHKAIAEVASEVGGRILDVGCGDKPYRDLFHASEYVGLEIDTPANRARKQAEWYYDGTTFPSPDDAFDSIICNQVLEHVFTPDRFLTEIRRVLKPGGNLLLTVPFVWDEHEQPWDYARYSSFGLKSLLENSGFEVIRHSKINADVRALFQLVNAYLYKVTRVRKPALQMLVVAIVMSPFNWLGLILYRLMPRNEDLYLDQIVLARKVLR